MGILDVLLMIYTVMNESSYSSSLNIFAIAVGILLMRGNARTARVVRWMSGFLVISMMGALLILLAMTPTGLFVTQMKLDAVATLMPFITTLIVMILMAWVFWQLSGGAQLEAMSASGFRTGPPFTAAVFGVLISAVLVYLLVIMLGGEQGDRARALAREQLGDGYAYHVTSMNIVNDSGQAIVVAYNNNEVQYVQVSW